MPTVLRISLVSLTLALVACGSSASYAPAAEQTRWGSYDDADVTVVTTEATGGLRRELERGSMAAYQSAGAPARLQQTAQLDGAYAPEAPEPLDEPPAHDGPLLIYNARVTLAIYQVEEVQASAVALAESAGGWVSERSRYTVVLRVPAERFRDVLDELRRLGDVLALDWDASDVTEAYTDLEIRLRNALEVRERLAGLLERAETVEEALAIERELERVTLDIEQMRGQLRMLADRIAYSTITVNFQELRGGDVPSEDYRLPFPWLNELGLERLLSI